LFSIFGANQEFRKIANKMRSFGDSLPEKISGQLHVCGQEE